ncbi:MAG: Mth938-like domain-containing protein [bacterium]
MKSKVCSPRITHLSWGRVEVEGQSRRFKDAKLFPGGSRQWDWQETGTQHLPGIQTTDVEELLEHGSEVVVLSRGFYGQLQVCSETLQMLKDRHIRTHILRTEAAVQLYNALCAKELVGGLFHSTC